MVFLNVEMVCFGLADSVVLLRCVTCFVFFLFVDLFWCGLRCAVGRYSIRHWTKFRADAEELLYILRNQVPANRKERSFLLKETKRL